MLAVLAAFAFSASANFIMNPGFETEDKNGVDDAKYWFDDDGVKGQRTDSVSRTGDWAMEVFDSGTWIPVSQWVDITDGEGNLIDAGGMEFEISAWALYTDPDFSRTGILKAEFWGSGSKLGQEDTWFLNNNDPIDTWKQGVINAVAPSGTNKIKLQFMNGNSEKESVYFDDGSVSVVTEPTTFEVLGIGAL